MGDPKKQRRKYDRPKHPWKADRILEESELCKKYGLKNKKEVWRTKSALLRFRQQARRLLGLSGEEIDKEKTELVDKLTRLGILTTGSVDDVLALTVDDLLGRRLQTIVYKKGLVNTIKEARQCIVHRHVLIGTHIVNVPSYTVSKIEENKICLCEGIDLPAAKVIPAGEKGNQNAGNKAPMAQKT